MLSLTTSPSPADSPLRDDGKVYIFRKKAKTMKHFPEFCALRSHFLLDFGKTNKTTSKQNELSQ
jgi:hypothetical protein